MPTNRAAWFTTVGAPFEVRSAPYPQPAHDQMVVKVGAVAVNPAEWILQYLPIIFPRLQRPFTMGSDVAGEVVQVGSSISRFKVGDRVLGNAVSTDKRSNDSAEGAFQEYVVLRETLVSPILDNIKYEDACVLPLGLSTAACGLYQKDYLALRYPSTTAVRTKEVLIVWGASTSVGSNAVQLANASGYDVIATASPKNFAFVKSLGAQEVFDYRNKTVVEDVMSTLKGRTCVGAMAIGDGSSEACIDILAASEGVKFVVQVSMPLASANLTTKAGRVLGLVAAVQFKAHLWCKSKIKGVQTKFVFGTDLMENEVGRAVYQDFLPEALVQRKYVTAPPALVVGRGLDKIQEGLDINRKGVSATKVVVSLP